MNIYLEGAYIENLVINDGVELEDEYEYEDEEIDFVDDPGSEDVVVDPSGA
jgi:hypothetical protein